MKSILIVAMLVTIVGCDSPMTEAHSEYQCRDKGGVYTYGNEFIRIKCNNGESIDYGQVTPLPKGWRVGDK